MADNDQIVDWDKFTEYKDNMTQVERKLIDVLFKNYVLGNSDLKERSYPEVMELQKLFRDGWIMSQSFCKTE